VLSDGTFIKAGQHVVIPSYALGRMESIWGPDVMDFKPERWIDQDSGKLIPVSSFKFSAFNGGPRICLGKNLAMMEMKIVAAGILSRFHMEVQEPEKIRYGFGVTLHLKDPLLVHVQQVDKQQCLPVAEMC
jgi:fatty acid omega-hydroxylase